MNERYAVDDGDGNRLTAGLQGEHQARIVAQRIANDLGDSVYLYQTDEDEENAETIEIKPETSNAVPFEPTHVITLNSGDRIEVQLVDGAAYTREEWNATDQADYERQDNGDWTFQGEPFAGTVKAI